MKEEGEMIIKGMCKEKGKIVKAGFHEECWKCCLNCSSFKVSE